MHILFLMCQILCGGLIMGCSSCLLREWLTHYKDSYLNWAGRMIFWGGGMALTAFLGGVPFEDTLPFVPAGISSLIIPPPYKIYFRSVTDNLVLIGLSIISFIPAIIILWLYGYFWPKMIMAACFYPLSYYMGNIIPSKIWQISQGNELVSFLSGFILGADLIMAILLKDSWQVWPPLPHIMNYVNN